MEKQFGVWLEISLENAINNWEQKVELQKERGQRKGLNDKRLGGVAKIKLIRCDRVGTLQTSPQISLIFPSTTARKSHKMRHLHIYGCECFLVSVYMCSPGAGLYLYRHICSGSMENDTDAPIGPSAWTLTRLTILTDYIKPGLRMHACVCVSMCVCVMWVWVTYSFYRIVHAFLKG